MPQLTREQAFQAMFYYLSDYWRRAQDARVADVLSDLQPAEAGVSSDPAAWQDWMNAVQRVLESSREDLR